MFRLKFIRFSRENTEKPLGFLPASPLFVYNAILSAQTKEIKREKTSSNPAVFSSVGTGVCIFSVSVCVVGLFSSTYLLKESTDTAGFGPS